MDAIETNRLVLRNFRTSDAADLFAYLHQPRASCFLSLALADMAAAAAEAAARSGNDEHIAVSLKTTDTLIGDLFAVAEEDTFSVGWHFNATVAGAGFASEAAHALFCHLFATRNARRLYAYVEDHNFASRRLCEQLGMRQEGLFKEFVSFTTNKDGAPIYENTMQFAILRWEWETRQ
ncbi:MAG: GNAT family N-acetyltransferase [Rhodopseudomonas palustris]|uniref:GNAT family N-acetyltransferase n=1 Tax=Rhodopseudomonas palustris TaxID=1076 RepID=A0A933S4X5_RHOPL|nr:GNAT family N-acetyltransferase [Rhodopseudomonas palustris]